MIQVHRIDKNGKTIGIANRLAADNTDCVSEAKKKALWEKADAIADQWNRIFPNHKYAVVDVSREQVTTQMKWYKSDALG